MRSLVVALAMAAALPAALAAQGFFDRNAQRQPGARTWLAERAKLPPFTPPRHPDGRPNLEGRWGGSYSGDDIEETDYIDSTTPPAESRIGNPPDGKIPYQPWALAERNKHRAGLARGWPGETGERLYMDPQTFCIKNVPRYSQRGFELSQQHPGFVVMMLNWGHYFRSIPIGGGPPPGPAAKFWMGIPRGRYEGDTLVVETTNLNGKMWLDSVGNFYSANAKVTERFRLVDANTIDYEVTIDDPTVFTRTWTINAPLRRQGTNRAGGQDNNAANPYASESWEHACHEGNGHHVESARELGFKWFEGVTPPKQP